MPKRQKEDDNRSILKRLKKLEKKLRRSRSRRRESSSSRETSRPPSLDNFEECDDQNMEVEQIISDPVLPEQNQSDLNTPGQDPPLLEQEPEVEIIAQEDQTNEQEILSLLGDDPSAKKKYGDPIQKDVAVRWQYIALNGLSSEQRKELQDKYLIPENCISVGAPEINPELKPAISEFVSKKDKGIEARQKQLAVAIACVGKAITKVMAITKDPEIIRLLNDGGRLMCDCTYIDSRTRRASVLSTLKKEIKDQISESKIDEFLFGSELNEKLKAAKAINKQGDDIKNRFTTQAPSKQRFTPNQNRQLNYKAPFQPRMQPRGQRGGRAPQSTPSSVKRPAVHNQYQHQRQRHPYNRK